MRKVIKLLIYACSIMVATQVLHAASAIDPPVIDSIGIESSISYNTSTGFYEYDYIVTNPSTNTAKLISIHIDLTRHQQSELFNTSELTISQPNSSPTFGQLQSSRINPALMVPVGINTPPGWWGSIGGRGYAAFNAKAVGNEILPGTVSPSYQILSRGIPTVRDVEFLPAWIYVSVTPGGITEEESAEGDQLSKIVKYQTKTIGPSVVIIGSIAHWDQIKDDIDQANSLGWVPDNTIYTEISTGLANARSAFLSRDVGSTPDGTLSKEILNSILTLLSTVTPGQILPSANDMFRINIELLIPTIPDTPPPPIPFEAAYTLTPETSTNDVGTTHTLIAKAFNKAHNNDPIEGYPVYMYIETGPNRGEDWWGYTDANGEFSVSYIGTQPGTDHILWAVADVKLDNPLTKKVLVASTIMLPAMLEGSALYPYLLGQARVTWENGADLVIPLFAPPNLFTKGGNTVTMTEITENIGLSSAAASTTRYYLSDAFPFNVSTARVIGERRVPLLGSNEVTDVSSLDYIVPNDLAEGIYFMAACADADNEIVELDETNNCSFNKLHTSTSTVIGIIPDPNKQPICDSANASKDLLWPPNHKLHKVTINGVTDPDDDPVTIKITSIEQDEPVNGLGDGDTSPDGFGVGTPIAEVRAERSGLENGRIYIIGFEAKDDKDASCTGSVQVGVPHDQGSLSIPKDSGDRYDSTLQ